MASSTKTLKVAAKGSTPVEIPWLVYGAFSTGVPSVRQAIEVGITHIDTAHVYGQTEEELGQLLKELKLPRNSFYLTTKLTILQEGQTVRDALTIALNKLGVDYVDFYLIHTSAPWLKREGRLSAVWKEFEQLKRDGLAKNIGISNFNADHLRELLEGAEIVPGVHQLELHPYLYKRPYAELLELHKKHGILTSAFGPIRAHHKHPDGPLAQPLTDIAKRLSTAYGKPVNDTQVLLKWMESQEIIPVIASSKADRLLEFLEVPNLPALTAAEVRSIEEAGEKLHYRGYDNPDLLGHMDHHLKP